jgi:MoaA/NifB/PqqE/SkfB family radical SAM enzyme
VWRDSERRTSSSNELSYEEIIDLLIDLKRIGVKHIGYSGGEPFLKERFLDILRVGHELGFHQVVSTNGTLIDENIGRMLVKYVDGIGISIDGPCPEVHDKIRGVEGAFNKAVKALSILNSLKKNFAGIGFVISKLNYREIPRMLDLARSLGVGIGFQPVHIFGVVFPRKVNYSFEDISFNDEDVTELARIIQYLIAQGYCAGNPIKEEYVKGIVDFIRGEKKRLCVVGYLGLTIGPDGSVYPCSFSHKVGNVRERSIEEIWKSPDYQKIRGIMLSCKKCYLGCYEAINIPINKFLTKLPFYISTSSGEIK